VYEKTTLNYRVSQKVYKEYLAEKARMEKNAEKKTKARKGTKKKASSTTEAASEVISLKNPIAPFTNYNSWVSSQNSLRAAQLNAHKSTLSNLKQMAEALLEPDAPHKGEVCCVPTRPNVINKMQHHRSL
jgi:hypothetical protein